MASCVMSMMHSEAQRFCAEARVISEKIRAWEPWADERMAKTRLSLNGMTKYRLSTSREYMYTVYPNHPVMRTSANSELMSFIMPMVARKVPKLMLPLKTL